MNLFAFFDHYMKNMNFFNFSCGAVNIHKEKLGSIIFLGRPEK